MIEMAKGPEAQIQAVIIDYLGWMGHKIFRVNVVRGRTVDGRYMSSGVPVGYSDLSGCRGDNGKAIFIEVKAGKNKPTEQQARFLLDMLHAGAHAGVAHSINEAVDIVEMRPDTYQKMEDYLYCVLEKYGNGQRQKINKRNNN